MLGGGCLGKKYLILLYRYPFKMNCEIGKISAIENILEMGGRSLLPSSFA